MIRFKLLNSKKGFDVNQMFIYVTAVVVVGFVLVFGFQAIQGFLDTQGKIENLQLIKSLEKDIAQVGNEHGSQLFFQGRLPNDYEQLCFFDLEEAKNIYGDGTGSCSSAQSGIEDIAPRLCPIWNANFVEGTEPSNVVMVTPDRQISNPLYIEGIKLEVENDDGSVQRLTHLCVDSKSVVLKLRGFKRQVFISESEDV